MPDTSPPDRVAEAFEAQRDRLRAVAYRMLGSHADAEDVVQEAWLRLSRQDSATIHNLAGWLTTVVGRISLDVLRSRQAHPEASYDDRLPELVVTVDDGALRQRKTWRSPTRSGSRSSSSSSRSGRASGWPSSCTTCSRCRSTRSARSSASPPTPPRCSPAAPAGRCRRPSRRRPTDGSNERWSRPSWRQPATATSRGCCACSTPT
jgi:hypothetical protein